MAAKNDITGDTIATRNITDTYRNNYDLIFRKKKDEPAATTDDPTGQPEPTNPDPKP